jgi:flagellar motor component MotA
MGSLKALVKRGRAMTQYLLVRPQLKTFLTAAALGLIFYAAFPHTAMAWDANAAALSILSFFKTLIIVGAAATAVLMVFRSQIIPAVVVVIAAAFFYVILTPEIMQSIGEGLKALFKLSGSSGP